MICIRYDADSLSALIVTDSATLALARIQSAFHDAGIHYGFTDPSTISTPWWSFLPLAPRIGSIIDSSGDTLTLDEHATREMARVREQRKAQRESAYLPEQVLSNVQMHLEAYGFKRALTPKQVTNVAFMASRPGSADFSVPGAGKTTTALAWFALHYEATGGKLLVVCPKNAFVAWDQQIRECFKNPEEFTPVRLVGSEDQILRILEHSEAKVFVVGYQRFAQPETRRHIASFLYRQKSSYLVLDESHRIKRGNSGQWGSAALSIAHIPTARLILSGTPVPNSTSDLVPQYLFLSPHERVDESNVAEKIKSVYVRTTKPDLNLPPIYRRRLTVDMGPQQQKLYSLLKSEARRQLEGMNPAALNQYRAIGKSVIKLLQAAANPALLANDVQHFHAELYSALAHEGLGKKIELACELTRRLTAKGKKVLIWSSFVDNVEVVASRLSDLGADYIHGGVGVGSEEDEDTREAKIKRFHVDDSAMVLVANPAAAGESISLHTACHHAIYIDRTFNAAHYLQSEDRIYRYGLKPHQGTFIFQLTCRNSIDEVVGRRLTDKINVMSEILSDPSIRIDRPLDLDTDAVDSALDDADLAAFMKHLGST